MRCTSRQTNFIGEGDTHGLGMWIILRLADPGPDRKKFPYIQSIRLWLNFEKLCKSIQKTEGCLSKERLLGTQSVPTGVPAYHMALSKFVHDLSWLRGCLEHLCMITAVHPMSVHLRWGWSCIWCNTRHPIPRQRQDHDSPWRHWASASSPISLMLNFFFLFATWRP